MNPADYWRSNADLQHITPPGDCMPEVGLFQVLSRVCKGKVFEFGCGYGRLAPAFAQTHYVGYDINLAAIKAAEERNPNHRFTHEWEPHDTFLAHTVLLHIPDDEIESVLALSGPRIVIGEIMGRQWRRSGNPPVFNREAEEYEAMIGRKAERIAIPYPRYGCHLTMLVFNAD